MFVRMLALGAALAFGVQALVISMKNDWKKIFAFE